MEIKAKPCPFCGGQAAVEWKSKNFAWHVRCIWLENDPDCCGLTGPKFNGDFTNEAIRRKSIKAWNNINYEAGQCQMERIKRVHGIE